MANVWDWFDQIYCGTVAISHERHEFMADQATRLGMRFRWITGELAAEKRNLANTENHLNAYRDALEHGYKRILMMEDDCFYLPEVAFLPQSLDDLGTLNSWGICYLGAFLYGPLIEIGRQYLRRVSKAVWLHSYAISDTLMLKLLQPEFMELCKEKPLDLVIHEQILPTGVGYVCKPMVANQRACWSEVVGRHEDMQAMWEDSLRWMK